jgi:AAA ATPase domain
MPAPGSIPNPYDFRSPIRDKLLLAARSETLEQIDGFLRQSAAGHPVHFSLFGPSGVGKSSLLRATVDIAVDRRLLPIRLSLREATVESELAFYSSVFETALQSLIQRGVLKEDSALMTSWTQEARGGRLDIPEGSSLEIALALSADLNGKVVRRIQVPSLMRDISRLLSCGGDFKGIAVCLDSADHLDDNRDVADSLLELADADPRVVLVTAAPQAGRLQSAASRTWAQIEVGPFLTPQEVFDAMTRPIGFSERATFDLKPAAAEDIYTLTRGHPYEVNLVCHFIWEAVQGRRQAAFQLSDAVIERVLGELIERGRHQSSQDLALVAKLTARDYELLRGIAPYESLTVKELALTRLMPQEFDDDTLAQLEGGIRSDLATLAQRQIIEIQDDRFSLTVGDDARLYLRYAAERHVGERLTYGQTYTEQVTRVCRQDFGNALSGEDSEDAHLIAVWRPHEVGLLQTGTWLGELRDAVAAGDTRTLAAAMQVPLDLGGFAANREKGIILYSFVLRVGLQEIEHATFALNVRDLDEEDLVERADAWKKEKHEFLLRYGITVVELACERLNPTLADGVIALAHLEKFRSLAISLYVVRQVEPAVTLFASAMTLVEALIGAEPTDPLVRERLSDAFNRRGFMLASLERWDEALDALGRSEELSMEKSWVTTYNSAYVTARQQNFAEAAGLGRAAVDALADAEVPGDGAQMILHADLPIPAGWPYEIPWIRIVHVEGAWLDRFLKLQEAVWHVRADSQRLPALEAELSRCDGTAPLGVLLLAGWAELMIVKRRDRGLKFLDRAVEATALSEVERAREEVNQLRDTPDLALLG